MNISGLADVLANWFIKSLAWTDVITELIDKFWAWTDVICELMEGEKSDGFRASATDTHFKRLSRILHT